MTSIFSSSLRVRDFRSSMWCAYEMSAAPSWAPPQTFTISMVCVACRNSGGAVAEPCMPAAKRRNSSPTTLKSAEQSLRTLRERRRTARLRRRLTLAEAAAENGRTRASVGTYWSLLWACDFRGPADDLADPAKDVEASALETRRVRAGRRRKTALDNDFRGLCRPDLPGGHCTGCRGPLLLMTGVVASSQSMPGKRLSASPTNF